MIASHNEDSNLAAAKHMKVLKLRTTDGIFFAQLQGM
jgi:hypothetical protein